MRRDSIVFGAEVVLQCIFGGDGAILFGDRLCTGRREGPIWWTRLDPAQLTGDRKAQLTPRQSTSPTSYSQSWRRHSCCQKALL